MDAFFKFKPITPPKRVCLRLKEERLRLGVSLETLSDKTKISVKHLRALEECRFKELPSATIYQKNFVKKYVEALKINSAPFLDQYQQEEEIKKEIKHPHKVIKYNFFSHLPVIMRVIIIASVVLLLIGYFGWQVKNIVEPPHLYIFSPLDGAVVSEQTIIVQGETDKEVAIDINGKNVMNSEDGKFKEEVDLMAGVNSITITVKKKHGKTTVETCRVVYREVVDK